MCHYQIYSLKLTVGADGLCIIVNACRHTECVRRRTVVVLCPSVKYSSVSSKQNSSLVVETGRYKTKLFVFRVIKLLRSVVIAWAPTCPDVYV